MINAVLKLSFLVCLALYFSACAQNGGGGAASASPVTATPDTSNPLVPVVVPGAPSNFSLTYYKLSNTSAPVSGWPTKTVTVAGSCVTYQSYTYCWDDGIKTLSWNSSGTNYGPYTYTYWGMNRNTPSNWGPCSGACTQDLMSSPTYTSSALTTMITALKINSVLTTGTAKTVTCAVANGYLNCVDFVVDLNQQAL